MKLSRKQSAFLTETIDSWEKSGTLSKDTANILRESYETTAFDWKKLAKYSFWAALVCIIIAFTALIADELLINLLAKFFSLPAYLLSTLFTILAAIFYYVGIKRREQKPANIYSNESIFFIGILLTGVAVTYFGIALEIEESYYSILILTSTIIYGTLGIWFPSKLIWIFSLLSLGTWFGTQTGYISGWGAYFLGMNYPLRFVLFGALLVGLSFFMMKYERLQILQKSTYIIGLLYLFISLWLLSIFGNYGEINSWYDAKQIELFHWGLLFGLVAIAAIIYGLKYHDYTSRSFGITFLFINLYTKYFEFFWNGIHKAIFFAILAISLWYIGTRAEKIWNLEYLKSNLKSSEGNSNEN
ncbi:MAG: DUF2157 domain-containing protein [Balneolaceae bacterium]|nr:MAG: DUF2157 domain-containing protein [Balneolaceae bacterium]